MAFTRKRFRHACATAVAGLALSAVAPGVAADAAIREKHGMAVPDDDEHLRALTAEGRVLLAITPDGPPPSWTSWGLG